MKHCQKSSGKRGGGGEFQIIGLVTVKALSPNVFKLDFGTINNLESWDLNTQLRNIGIKKIF